MCLPSQTTKKLDTGIGLIEAVVVISIISVAFAAILSAAVFFLRGGLMATDKTQALFLLEESVEATRFLRSESYSINITPLVGAGVRYLDPTAGGWDIATTSTPIFGKFTRTILLEEVYRRNSDDDIIPAASGDPKTIDSGTVRLTVSIDWGGHTVNAVTYVTNLYEN